MKLPQNLLLLAALLFVPSVSSADSVTLVTSRDTTIYQAHPGNSNGAGQDMFVGNTGQGTAARALIGFDIAGNVPAGSTITNVQLQLVLDQAAQFEFNTRGILLLRLLADWGEGTAGQGSGRAGSGAGFGSPANGTAATWSHRFYNTVPWATAGGDFAQTASGSTVVGITPMTYVWNSTPGMVSDVQGWLDNPASNFGWLLLGDESTASTARVFFTREAPDSASRPALVVTYTPPSVATASQLLVTTPTNVVAGAPFDITVTAVDSNGNIVPGYTGTVAFSSSDPFPGTVPATYTFTAADQGTHTFAADAALFTAGSQTVTVQDTANPSITNTATISVTAAPAKTLLVTALTSAVSNMPFDVLVTALDPYNNVDMNYAGTITWMTSDPDPGILLPPDYPFQPSDAGMHVFSGGVTLITVGTQTLTATDTVSGITGSAAITVTP